MILRRLLPLCLCVLALFGCRLRGEVDQQTFVILIESRSNDFRPVQGLSVMSMARNEVARTDADGRALFSVVGREGETADFLVQPPPGLLLAEGGERRRVVLKRLRALSGGYSSVNIVDHGVKLRRRKLPFVVLLATNQFRDLPVTVFGVERTRLNSRGVAMFLHEGMPGDELTVTILTEGNPLIAPVSPSKTFVLPDTPSQLFWRQDLTVRKVNTPPPVKKNNGKKRSFPTPV